MPQVQQVSCWLPWLIVAVQCGAAVAVAWIGPRLVVRDVRRERTIRMLRESIFGKED